MEKGKSPSQETPPYNIMYEKKINYFLDEVYELYFQPATFLYCA